ncbi:hypothetical protein Ancab_013296 [Ancistrocladus abbreviatus]
MSSKDRGIVDLEAGNNGELYPMMMEPPEVRWAFIRKVYAIVFIQLFLTAIVAAIVGFVRSISRYLVSTTPGLAIYILVLISPFIIMCPLFAYRQRHPLNFILLALFINRCVGLFSRHVMCFCERESYIGGCDFNMCYCSEPNPLHILGSKERPGF